MVITASRRRRTAPGYRTRRPPPQEGAALSSFVRLYTYSSNPFFIRFRIMPFPMTPVPDKSNFLHVKPPHRIMCFRQKLFSSFSIISSTSSLPITSGGTMRSTLPPAEITSSPFSMGPADHLTHRFSFQHQPLHQAFSTSGRNKIILIHQSVQLFLQIRVISRTCSRI